MHLKSSRIRKQNSARKIEHFLVGVDKEAEDFQKSLVVVGFQPGLVLSLSRLLRITTTLKISKRTW